MVAGAEAEDPVKPPRVVTEMLEPLTVYCDPMRVDWTPGASTVNCTESTIVDLISAALAAIGATRSRRRRGVAFFIANERWVGLIRLYFLFIRLVM